MAVILVTLGCSYSSGELSMYRPASRSLDHPALTRVFQERAAIEVVEVASVAGVSPVDALESRMADLALVENSTPFREGLRAVLPIYRSVLHIMVDEQYLPDDESQPVRGAHIFLANDSDAARALLRVLLKRQRLSQDDITLQEQFTPGETDLVVYFGPIDPSDTSWYQPGFILVSFAASLGRGPEFDGEGVALIIPNMGPAKIPALTYDLPGNEDPVPTIAVDTLLATHKDASEEAIFEITRLLIEEKQRFTAVAPQLFGGINESFDPLGLNFPLHPGARRYLERDDPGMLERYAETINLLVYLSFLALTGLFALARWRHQRKKDRIDTFYMRVLAVRDRIGGESASDLLAELDALEKEAFSSLIAEKLSANESFRIFTELLSQVRDAVNASR